MYLETQCFKKKKESILTVKIDKEISRLLKNIPYTSMLKNILFKNN